MLPWTSSRPLRLVAAVHLMGFQCRYSLYVIGPWLLTCGHAIGLNLYACESALSCACAVAFIGMCCARKTLFGKACDAGLVIETPGSGAGCPAEWDQQAWSTCSHSQ
jgi:hypothetical protein